MADLIVTFSDGDGADLVLAERALWRAKLRTSGRGLTVVI